MSLINILNNLFYTYYARFIFKSKIYAFGKFDFGNKKNIIIGKNSRINKGVYIQGRCNTEIGENVILSARTMIFDSGLDYSLILKTDSLPHIESYVKIENNVWVGAGSIILPGVTIGHHSVIAAGSVVNKNVMPFSLVGGNPARLIRKINEN